MEISRISFISPQNYTCTYNYSNYLLQWTLLYTVHCKKYKVQLFYVTQCCVILLWDVLFSCKKCTTHYTLYTDSIVILFSVCAAIYNVHRIYFLHMYIYIYDPVSCHDKVQDGKYTTYTVHCTAHSMCILSKLWVGHFSQLSLSLFFNCIISTIYTQDSTQWQKSKRSLDFFYDFPVQKMKLNPPT